MTTRAKYLIPLFIALVGGLIGIVLAELTAGTAYFDLATYVTSVFWLGAVAYLGYREWRSDAESRRVRLTLVSVVAVSALVFVGLTLLT